MAQTCAADAQKIIEKCYKNICILNNNSDSSKLEEEIKALNSITYLSDPKYVNEFTASSILLKCVQIIPVTDERQLTQLCKLITNVITIQELVVVNHLHVIFQYFLNVLKENTNVAKSEILKVLAALIYDNSHRLEKFYKTLVGPNGILLRYADGKDKEAARAALTCLTNLCQLTSENVFLKEDEQNNCFEQFVNFLHAAADLDESELTFCWRLYKSVSGLRNLVQATKKCPPKFLTPILAALKAYMLFGLPGFQNMMPESLYITPITQYVPSNSGNKSNNEKQNTFSKNSLQNTPNKNKKDRRHPSEKEVYTTPTLFKPLESEVTTHDVNSKNSEHLSNGLSRTLSLFDYTTPISTSSDSEFSDNDSQRAIHLRNFNIKVRKVALGCLHDVFKFTDIKVLFGYWSCFLPDSIVHVPPKGKTLFTCIFKDPNPRNRTTALDALNSMLENSKNYLMMAEDSETYGPFTPFANTLGHMIKELHRCLLLALTTDIAPSVITRALKCLTTLISNVPYHRLRPGFLTKVVKSVMPFISHFDARVVLAVMGCLSAFLSVQGPSLEVWQILNTTMSLSQLCTSNANQNGLFDSRNELGSDMSSYQNDRSRSSRSSVTSTPLLTSGEVTPFQQESSTHEMSKLCWILELSILGINSKLLESYNLENSTINLKSVFVNDENNYPILMMSSSLQLLQHLARGYSVVFSKHLDLLQKVIQSTLLFSNNLVISNSSKLLHELCLSFSASRSTESSVTKLVNCSDDEITTFWINVLNDPVTSILQDNSKIQIREILCGCLADIGWSLFNSLPLHVQILSITMLLGLCSDNIKIVKFAALRALGLIAQFPSQQQDISFITDVANAVLDNWNSGDPTENNRVRAAGCLCSVAEAISFHKETNEDSFSYDFPDEFLIKLIIVANQAAGDREKIKCHGVRALGSLIGCLPETCCADPTYNGSIKASIDSLMKGINAGTAKTRWNTCYAVSRIFKNEGLMKFSNPWMVNMLNILSKSIKNSRNSKVRISAASALCSIKGRHLFGFDQSFTTLWEALLTGLKSSEEYDDFSEYKYRENLIEQLCLTLCRLGNLMIADDLVTISSALRPYQYMLYDYLYECCHMRKDTSEIRSSMLKAVENLHNLKSTSLTNEMKTALTYIEHNFKIPLQEIQVDEKSKMKSTFIQSYD